MRDTRLSDISAAALDGKTDLPFTEVKTEVAIDRVTSAANPRQMERVPAGAEFDSVEMVYSLYDGPGCGAKRDVENLSWLVDGLLLLEDDYLGGLGSRGSGKVKLKDIRVQLRNSANYAALQLLGKYDDLKGLSAALHDLQASVRNQLGII